MTFLFHGTIGEHIEKIFQEGLWPPSPAGGHETDWTWSLTGLGHGDCVFLSTSPIASRDGDPVYFSTRRPHYYRRRPDNVDAYIVVVDLPEEAHDYIHALIPNVEFDHFWESYSIRRFLLDVSKLHCGPTFDIGLSTWCLLYWLARYFQDTGVALTPEALQPHMRYYEHRYNGDFASHLTHRQWLAFLDDYLRFMYSAPRTNRATFQRRRQGLLRKFDITLPDHIEEDWHSSSCRLCLEGLFTRSCSIIGYEQYPPLRDFLNTLSQNKRQPPLPTNRSLSELHFSRHLLGNMLDRLPFLLHVVREHTAPYDPDDILRFFVEYETGDNRNIWTWRQWYRFFPLNDAKLPRVWLPNYGKNFTAHDLLSPDQQAITEPIPPRYILGAIRLSDGYKLLPHMRPNRRKGQTLQSLLWHAIHELRAAHQGSPVVLDKRP